mmetsp:Transcript_22321/g.63473  ORF Transcript_22321/g.63473 Transcript_22321/m.63473 type:complete len:222 (+) Transcript_22321:984-1649(+)
MSSSAPSPSRSTCELPWCTRMSMSPVTTSAAGPKCRCMRTRLAFGTRWVQTAPTCLKVVRSTCGGMPSSRAWRPLFTKRRRNLTKLVSSLPESGFSQVCSRNSSGKSTESPALSWVLGSGESIPVAMSRTPLGSERAKYPRDAKPPAMVEMSVMLAKRLRSRSASSWVTIPPIERPTMWTHSVQPRWLRSESASRAMSRVVQRPGTGSEKPMPRLSYTHTQ